MRTPIDFLLCQGIPLVRAAADGRAGWFAFDTGAMKTTLNSTHFPNLQGEPLDILKYDGDVKGSSARSGTISRFSFGGRTLERLDVLCMDMGYVETALRTQNPNLAFLGSIGIDVIGVYDVLLDYACKTITMDPKTDLAGWDEVPLTMGKLPMISCTLDGATYRFVLDSCAGVCLIGQDMAKRLVLRPYETAPHLLALPPVVIGHQVYAQLQTVVSDMTEIHAKTGADGVIGYPLFARQQSLLGFRSGVLKLDVLGT